MPTDEPTDSPPDAPTALSRARRVASRAPDGAAGLRPRPESKRTSARSGLLERSKTGEAADGDGAAEPTQAVEPTETREPTETPDAASPPGAAGPLADVPGKAGRNLPIAIGVGVGLLVLVVGTLFVYRPSFAVLVGIAVLYGSWELAKAFRSADIRLSLVPILLGGVAMLVAAWERGPSGLVVALLITIVGVLVWRVADGAHGYTRDAAASTLVVLYLPLLAGFAVLLVHPDDGAARVLAFIITVVCSDTGGYASGVLFGRHPLAPVVSKGKTWEGFAGSVLACAAAGVLVMTLTFHEAWWKGLLFGAAIVLTATLGDLGESMIKRDLGIKDMGSLLPGHGGMMDRLDSLLPCAAVAYLVLSAFAPV